MASHKSVRYVVLLLLLCYSLKNTEYGHAVTDFFKELLDLKTSTIVTRTKRETPVHFDIIVDLSFPASTFSMGAINTIQSVFQGIALPQNITPFTNVTEVFVTTGCFPIDGNLQCRCLDQFMWSCGKCNVYGACFENVRNETCDCIKGVPSDGTFCQPITSIDDCPPTPVFTSTTPMTTLLNTTTPMTTLLNTTTPMTTLPNTTTPMTTLPNTTTPMTTLLNTTTPMTTLPNTTTPMTTLPNTTTPMTTLPNTTTPMTTLLNTTTPMTTLPNTTTPMTTLPNTTTPMTTLPNTTTPMTTLPNTTTPMTTLPNTTTPMTTLPNTTTPMTTLPNTTTPMTTLPNTTTPMTTLPNTTTPMTTLPNTTTPMTTLPNTTTPMTTLLNTTTPMTTLPNTTTPMTTLPNTTTPMTTLPNTTTPMTMDMFYSIVADFSFPGSLVSTDLLENIKSRLSDVRFQPINSFLSITYINVTTTCLSTSDVGLQCQCEDQFLWSCDQCNIYGTCSNVTHKSCDCINGLPSDGSFCEATTSVNECPTTTPVFTSTTPMTTLLNTTTPMTTLLNTTTPMTTLLNTTTPMTTLLNTTTPMTTLPNTTTPMTTLLNTTTPMTTLLNTTTPMTTLPNTTTPMTTLPNTTTPMTTLPNTTTPMTTLPNTTTPMTTLPNTTTPMTTLPNTTTPMTMDMFYSIVADFSFPGSLVSTDLLENIKSRLSDVRFQPINSFLSITYINVTTTCLSTSDVGLQCQCEDQFLWSCDQCNIYGTCSNVTHKSCDCINGLPSDGSFCEATTSVNECPTTTPVITTTTPMTTLPNTTAMTTLPNTTAMTTLPNTTTMTTLPNTTAMTTLTNTTTMTTLTNTTTMTTLPNTTAMTTLPNTTAITTLPNTTTMTTLPNITTMTTLPNITTMSTLPNITMSTLPNTPVNLTLEFVLNINFNPSYNDEDNSVRKDVVTSTEFQSRRFIKDLVNVEFGSFRSGSTIANFTIFANSEINQTQEENLLIGMFNNLSSKYPVIFEGSRFQSEEAFTGSPLTLTCDPPPKQLALGSELTGVWLLNGEIIQHHSSSIHQDFSTTLSVSRVYNTDNGLFECQLRTPSGSRFRRRADKFFTVKEKPVIIVNRIQQLVSCDNPKVEVECSVNEPYEVSFPDFPDAGTSNSITFSYEPETCENETFSCEVKDFEMFKKNIELVLSTNRIICINDMFGNGTLNFKAVVDCEEEFEGQRTAICRASTKFEDVEENCILRVIKNLLDQSETLTPFELPQFLQELSNATVSFSDQIVNSTATTNAIVEIFKNIAEVARNTRIQRQMMEDVLLSAGILTTDGARGVWQSLNKVTPNTSETDTSDPIRRLQASSQRLFPSQSRTSETTATSVSGSFLLALETITSRVVNTTISISTPSILLNKTTVSEGFSSGFNSSVEIDLPESDGDNVTLTVVTFLSMDNVLPPRDEVNSSSKVINGRVVIVQSFSAVNNISFTFEALNTSLDKPQCVFWNFTLFDGLGGWDGSGCELVLSVNDTVTCNCNHLTSFSMLMSFGSFESVVLDYITYIGVSISLASLIICLIIEAVIWRKLRNDGVILLRHISIVNIAVSLLIADIWFLVGAAISGRGDTPACTAATFFIHLFYLALFFWMLSAALLLLYHVVDVVGQKMSKSAQIAIGFVLGYGVPIIITVITIAVTAPDDEYIQRSGLCWLNIKDSLALLAFVIPALLIVLINLIILIVVIYKIVGLRGHSGGAGGSESTKKLKGIIKTLAVLTPLFGITWGLGVGIIVDPLNLGVHITFAIFNSLQGLFILIFGTLLDGTVRTEMSKMSSVTSSRVSGTRTTSNGNASSGPNLFQRSRQSRGYNVSSGTNAEAQSFNT